LRNLPIVNVQLGVLAIDRCWKLKDMHEMVKRGNLVQLSPRTEYTLSVELKEAWGKGSWTIILGLEQELQAMKTVNTGARKVFLTFETPDLTSK
jgi:hypothetical protein